jgi:branched-subunit amino acid aminotransferase/4-amino-4-deoxychorismate lyase
MTYYCLDGVSVSESAAVLPADSGLVRSGEGWFETLRIEDGRAMFLEGHRARLRASLHAAKFDTREPLELFDATATSLIACFGEGEFSSEPEAIGRLRILVTPRDSGGWSALGRCEPYAPPIEWARSGVRTSVASLPHPQWGPLGKSTSYHWSRYAQREAEARGADEALLAREGVLIEAASAALLWRRSGQWHTSDGQGELPSVTLAELRSAGVKIAAGVLRESDLGQLEALCLVSALRLAVAVATVDSQPVAAALDQAQALRNLLRARHRG